MRLHDWILSNISDYVGVDMVELVYLTIWHAVLIIAAIWCFVCACMEKTPSIGKVFLTIAGCAAIGVFGWSAYQLGLGL